MLLDIRSLFFKLVLGTHYVPKIFLKKNNSYAIILFKKPLSEKKANMVEQMLSEFGEVIPPDNSMYFSSYRVIAR